MPYFTYKLKGVPNVGIYQYTGPVIKFLFSLFNKAMASFLAEINQTMPFFDPKFGTLI